MRVRLRAPLARDNHIHEPGEVLDLAPNEARRLVLRGVAEPLDGRPVVESAALAGGRERAALPRATPR